jgi:iron(II)-dependent oxidoreductase
MRKVIICIVLVLLLSAVAVGVVLAQKGMRTVIGTDGILSEEPYRTKWALLIGINKYPNLPVQYQLHYAENDVKELKKVLLEQYQFHESNITTLVNEQATYNGIREKFAQLSDKNKIDSNDCVLIYFSGHGQTVSKPRGGEIGFLLPYDAKVDMDNVNDISSYYGTCMGMDELKRLAGMIPAKHIIFLVDACYSGLVVANRGGFKTSIPNYLKKVASVPVQQVITAGMKDDVSSESPEWGHGAFTYKLLEALRTGVADENDDGITTGLELAAYLRNVVPNISPKQTPQYGYFDGEGEFLFLQITKTESLPAPPSGSAFSLDDLKNEADRLETIEKAWDDKLNEMRKAYNDVKAFDSRSVTPNLKVSAWQKFIDSFKEDNPYSQDDDSMYQEARKQLDYWNKQPSETSIIGKDGAPMILIPAGEFQMGSDIYANEQPVHTVYLDAFYMDKYEVTNAQYKKFMASTGHKAPARWKDSIFNKPDQPVVCVTWEDAKAYASWAGKRLPTEAEREKAARGGLVGKLYPWGDAEPDGTQCNLADKNMTDLEWSNRNIDDGYKYTSPVGSFPPNGYRLYGMAGNIYEWCADWYDENYYAVSPQSNPTGPESGLYRVLRGGSWRDNSLFAFRVAYRNLYSLPTIVGDNIGFRCVQDISKQ